MFLNKFYDPSNPLSEISQFRLYVKDELEKRISEFPDLGIDGPEALD